MKRCHSSLILLLEKNLSEEKRVDIHLKMHDMIYALIEDNTNTVPWLNILYSGY